MGLWRVEQSIDWLSGRMLCYIVYYLLHVFIHVRGEIFFSSNSE